jgi:hypothetical protein
MQAQQPELLPQPQPLAAPEVIPLHPPVIIVQPIYPEVRFYRPSAYARWQDYGVGWDGRFRPRVISTPYHAYYHYNGEPYPWTATEPRQRMTYVDP